MNWIHNVYRAWHIISGICIIWVAWNYWNNRDCISETLPESECNHQLGINAHINDGSSAMVYFKHCPKCGELI